MQELKKYTEDIEKDIFFIKNNIQNELNKIELLYSNLNLKNINYMNELINKTIKTDPVCINTIKHYKIHTLQPESDHESDTDSYLDYRKCYGEYNECSIENILMYHHCHRECDDGCECCVYIEYYNKDIVVCNNFDNFTNDQKLCFLLETYIIYKYDVSFWDTNYITNNIFKDSYFKWKIDIKKQKLITNASIDKKTSNLLKKRNEKIKNKIIERLYNPLNGIIFKKRFSKYK